MELSTSQLVELITKKVLEALRPTNAEADSPSSSTQSKTGSSQPVLVVFTGGTASLDVVERQLAELSKLDCEFHCVFSKAAARIIGTDIASSLKPASCVVESPETESVYALVYKCKLLVVPVLTQNTCAKAALGIRDSLASDALACAFLMGKPVVIATDSVPVEGVPAPYRQQILTYLKTLESFGARLTKACHLAAAVRSVLLGVGATGQSGAVRLPGDGAGVAAIEAKLVDLKAAMEWVERNGTGEPLVVRPGCIITPLAADFLRERRVTVVRRAGEVKC